MHFFFIRIKIPVVLFLVSIVEYRNLSFKAADSTIYVWLFLFNADIVNQVAGGKVITAVDYYIIFLNDMISIFFRQPGRVGMYSDLAVESGEPFRCTDSFRFTQFFFGIENLSLQVSDAYQIVIYQSETSHTGACQVESDGRA